MKTFKRIALWFFVLIAVSALAVLLFARNMSHRAIPDYNKNLTLQGLHAPVTVFRDSFAIPHVYAADEHDLYLATGYLLAEDRLWQMDMLRRVTEGRLSEIFGAKFVDTDYLLRALRFRKKSEQILATSDEKCLEAINAFADGINQFIKTNGKRLPPEFGILKYKPEEWKPANSLNMIGYMAWDLKAGWSEVLLNEIQKAVDSVRFKQLLPDSSGYHSVIYPGSGTASVTVRAIPDLLLHSGLLQELGVDVLDASNNWAVSGAKSSTGMPLLANDMHLGLSVPGIWYQMHQVVKGKLNVTGVVLPGAPAIICGHNDSIAWGMTNTCVDNLDFYEEKINPADSGQYEFNGEWKNFEVEKIIINISKAKPVEKLLRFTRRGAVVSSFRHFGGKVVSMHWVGDEKSNEFRTVMHLNRANNWEEFKDALKTFTSISQNIAYADRKGNIGLYCAAGVPVRRRDISYGMLPGQTDAYDWKGYVPFAELPHILNPASGFVASANNRTAPREYSHHIGTWYSLPNRYERISELLSAKKILSVDDFRAIQLDQHSKLAEKYMPGFLKALSDTSTMNEVEKSALVLLQDWDFSMDAGKEAPAIFESMYVNFMRCVFGDEMGHLFEKFNSSTSLSRNATDQLIDLKVSPWFDNIITKNKVETLDGNILCAFAGAVANLRSRMGDDPKKWEWGEIHHLVLAHPLSSVKILDRIFRLNRGPFPAGGSFHTISPYSYDSNNPFDSNHGASHRHIFDVGNWDNSLTVIPTGISGIPASRHYCDQTELYVSGQYHHDYFSEDKVVSHAKYKMEFLPLITK